MKNIFANSIAVMTLIGVSAAYAAPEIITLNNATSCQVTIGIDNKPKAYKKVRSVDVFSMYYASNDSNSYSYYGVLPADTAGPVVISAFSPNYSPIMPSLNLGYSPSPGYLSGSLSYLRTDGNYAAMNNWYVYQEEVYEAAGCRARMRLAVADKNPCASQQ